MIEQAGYIGGGALAAIGLTLLSRLAYDGIKAKSGGGQPKTIFCPLDRSEYVAKLASIAEHIAEITRMQVDIAKQLSEIMGSLSRMNGGSKK